MDNKECWLNKKNINSWFRTLQVDGKVYKFELVSKSLGGKEVLIRGAVDFNQGDLIC